jgi:hypothetical protein
MMFEAFPLAIALGPLSVYLIVMGWLRCLRRPMVVTGSREHLTLAMALVGFVIIGPLELFFPRNALMLYGWLAWIMMLMLYLLSVLLWMLNSRPRLFVYGMDVHELQAQLRILLPHMDSQTQWLGDTFRSPQLGISALVENGGPGRISQVVALSHRQSLQGWVALERALVQRTQSITIDTRPIGTSLIGVGLGLLGLAFFFVLKDPAATAQAMRDMLRL